MASLTDARVLLTGRPGIGKTTLITRILDRLERPAAGFLTRELRQRNRRVGFEIQTLGGSRATLAHVDHPGEPRISRYGVNLAELEQVGVSAIERAMQEGVMVIVDEIGPMELLSERFREAIESVFATQLPILGTIMSRSHPFADRIKRRPDVELVEVTSGNRDELVGELAARWS